MTDVSIIPCPSYEPETVRQALERVLEPIGGRSWVSAGMKIVIKANLVSMMKPEKAATTHPSLLCALTDMLIEKGASVVIGDSPGGLYNAASLNLIYNATGMHDAEAHGASLNHNFETTEAIFENGLVLRDFVYTAFLDEADAIIDFCKLKTHGMMGMSAAAKNMFGAIPGTFKPEYHFRFPKHEDFAKMILDLNAYFQPKMRLCLVDAVVGMEGNGPTQGSPRQIGALLASTCPHKVDLLCASLIGLGIKDVPTLQAAFEAGLIPERVERLNVCGNADALRISDFQNIHVRKSMLFEGKGRFAATFVRTALRARPSVEKRSCIGCQKCAQICPAHIITMKNGKPMIDRKKCITCFCCQEFCPVGAMKVRRPLIARLLNRTKK